MRFDISMINSTKEQQEQQQHGLYIKLLEHSPPRRNTLMDTNWTLTGFTLHDRGGPFYIAATKHKEEILATFTGKFVDRHN